MEFAAFEESGKSMVVTGATFQADARGLEVGIFMLFVIVLAWGVSGLLSMGIEVLLENSGRARSFRASIEKRATFIPRFKKRREYLLKVVDQRNEGANTLQTERAKLNKKLNKLKSANDQLVRQIGESTVGSNCYSFLVANRYVLQYVAKGQQHPLLDDSWKNGQLVEVWSKTLMDARIAVVERYPATFGYFVEKLAVKGMDNDDDGEPGSGAAPSKGKKSAF